MALCAGAVVNQVRAADPVIYGSYYNGPGGLATLENINPNTGAATPIGSIGFDQVGAISFDPSSGTLYGVGNRISDGTQELITINPTTGAGTAVGATTLSANVQDIAFRNSDDALYGYVSGDIFTFNINTGVATDLGNADNFPSGNGLAFSPFDVLYKADNFNLSTIDQSNGSATPVTAMNYPHAGDRINAMKFDNLTGVLWASVKDGGVTNYLATVDIGNGVVTEIGATQTGTDGLVVALALIPEPGTFTLVGMGLVGLLTLRRRKK